MQWKCCVTDVLEKCKYKRDLYSTRYCYFNDLWTTQRVYRCLKWDHVIPAQLTAFKNRKKMFLNIHSFAHICKRDYVYLRMQVDSYILKYLMTALFF